ncbi:MAG TPA: chemotaxis response regulator protein-glutamate methylesterase [Gemmatimonadales bacterium]|nr:chemotaxis response regulator protein-glutamate methylesterase [Gemmatimonadales bacterium]
MPRIRVLIVDDAVVVRRMLTDVLSADPEIEVVGAAANGRIALAKLPQLSPDIVTLDIEMPELNGLDTIVELRKDYPRLPVIMFSTRTVRGATTTLEALSLGATDYCTKPDNVGSLELAQQRVRDELIPKIKALAGPRGRPATKRDTARVATAVAPVARAVRGLGLAPARPRTSPPPTPEVVAIGVSTGGPNALATLLPRLPADFPVPVLVVQHMPPLFTRFLADRLDGRCRVRVSEARAGMVLERGRVYIAPGDWHMMVERRGADVVITTHQGPPENSCRPAVDVLFRSCAAAYGEATLAIVLTGMGQDGLRGCQALSETGAPILVQDEPSSVVWGMPGTVAEAGLADQVLPLDQIAAAIVQRTSTAGPVPRSRAAAGA